MLIYEPCLHGTASHSACRQGHLSCPLTFTAKASGIDCRLQRAQSQELKRTFTSEIFLVMPGPHEAKSLIQGVAGLRPPAPRSIYLGHQVLTHG